VLPAVRPMMLFCVVLATISGLEMFDEPMILTQGGPADSTLTAVMYVYQQGFQFLQLGQAAAASYVLTLVIVAISIAQKLWLGRER
jgi:ABC-type sugar transport system permease subunit